MNFQQKPIANQANLPCKMLLILGFGLAHVTRSHHGQLGADCSSLSGVECLFSIVSFNSFLNVKALVWAFSMIVKTSLINRLKL